MKVDIEPNQIQEVEADNRGRIVVGTEWGNQ